MLAALLMFGDQLLMPVPDVDRTDYLLVLGGNPLVSNGSIMTAPDVRGRLTAIQARGGTRRRRRSAPHRDRAPADRHVFIRPGTDALLLMSMIQVLFAERLGDLGRLGPYVDGDRRAARDRRRLPARGDRRRHRDRAGRGPPPGPRAGRRPARRSPTAASACACRSSAALAAWLVYALNVLTGHLDEPGGAMLTTPAVDIMPLARGSASTAASAGGAAGSAACPSSAASCRWRRWPRRLRPRATGQIRALVTSAGNPVLSTPNGARLDRALAGLDFMVSIDPYLNETTRHAHVILPPTSPLERSHYDLAFACVLGAQRRQVLAAAVRAAGPTPATTGRSAWPCGRGSASAASRSAAGRARRRGACSAGSAPRAWSSSACAPGPTALRRGRAGLSLAKLRAAPHGVDLGPLEPRLPGRLGTPDKRDQAGAAGVPRRPAAPGRAAGRRRAPPPRSRPARPRRSR